MKKIKFILLAVAALLSGTTMAQKLVCPDVTLEDGTAELVFSIAENTDATATLVEFDLKMPDGISVEEEDDEYIVYKGSICKAAHSATAQKSVEGIYVLVMNPNKGAFKQANGEVVKVPIVANNDLADGTYQIQVVKVNITNLTPEKIAKETSLTINVTKGATGIKDVNADGMQADGKYLINGELIIKKGNSIFNGIGAKKK